MIYLIGLFISTVGFWLASQHLHQDIREYWDFVAFFVVILGTAAVMLVNFPAAPFRLLAEKFLRKFFLPATSLRKHSELCLKVINSRAAPEPKTIEAQLLADGLELLGLGFNREKTLELLSRRFEIYAGRINAVSSWLRRNAKYPPAFGLAGTVLGLIHLMRGISSGIDTKETGIRMAVALVATFYGILISNLVLNPLGEWLQEELKRDQLKAEMSLNSIVLILENANPIEVQENLNSFLSGSEKLAMNFGELLSEEAA